MHWTWFFPPGHQTSVCWGRHQALLRSLSCVRAHIRSHRLQKPTWGSGCPGFQPSALGIFCETKKKQIFKSGFVYCLYRATRSLKNEMKTQNTVIYKYTISFEVHFSMWIIVKETRNNIYIYFNCVSDIRYSICIYQLWENDQSNF